VNVLVWQVAVLPVGVGRVAVGWVAVRSPSLVAVSMLSPAPMRRPVPAEANWVPTPRHDVNNSGDDGRVVEGSVRRSDQSA
jgi:hypothetical protein